MNSIALVFWLLIAAWTAPAAPSATNLPPASFDGKLDIGGRKLRIVTYGERTPAVVVEAGGSQAGVENPQWHR